MEFKKLRIEHLSHNFPCQFFLLACFIIICNRFFQAMRLLSYIIAVIFMQVSAERNSDTGKENAAKGEQSGRPSSKKVRKTMSLSRPVSLK